MNTKINIKSMLSQQKAVIQFNTALLRLAKNVQPLLSSKEKMGDLISALKLVQSEAPYEIIKFIAPDIIKHKKSLNELNLDTILDDVKKQYQDDVKSHPEVITLFLGLKEIIPKLNPDELKDIKNHIKIIEDCSEQFIKSVMKASK